MDQARSERRHVWSRAAIFTVRHWIAGVQPQEPRAIEIMMKLVQDRDRNVLEVAVGGLSDLIHKEDQIVKALINVALDPEAGADLGI